MNEMTLVNRTEAMIEELEAIIAEFHYNSEDKSFLTKAQYKISQKCFNKYYPNYNGSW